jgi:hypothetical protein
MLSPALLEYQIVASSLGRAFDDLLRDPQTVRRLATRDLAILEGMLTLVVEAVGDELRRRNDGSSKRSRSAFDSGRPPS